MPAGRLVVDADVGIGGTLASGGHDADADKLQAVLFGLGHREPEHDDGVDLAPGWKLVEKRVPVGGIADVVEEHVKVGLAQYRLQRFEYGGEEPP